MRQTPPEVVLANLAFVVFWVVVMVVVLPAAHRWKRLCCQAEPSVVC